MPDRLLRAAATAPGRAVLRGLGVPVPAPLARHRPAQPEFAGVVRLGGSPRGRLRAELAALLKDAGAEVLELVESFGVDGGAGLGAAAEVSATDDASASIRAAALAFDATGLSGTAELAAVYAFVHGAIRTLAPCGRVVFVADAPEHAATTGAAVAARALEGFMRSLGKELRAGSTSHLLYVAPEATACLASPLRFLLSARSAYVDAQVIRVGPARPESEPQLHPHPQPEQPQPQPQQHQRRPEPAPHAELDWSVPLTGRVAAVTGAARGIGASIAERLAAAGAHVVCLDLPAQSQQLAAVARRIGGSAFTVDITTADAPAKIAAHLRAVHGGVDVFVHNAGITRDRTIAAMSRAEWDAVLAVNLGAVEGLTAALLEPGFGINFGTDAGPDPSPAPTPPPAPLLRDGGAIVCVSSIGGIAGNRGQTNYAASKAGVIGLVQDLAPRLAARGVRVNAVAPGFIETDMTARMPFLVRAFGRRMNSLGQGGLPIDVAETVAWLAAPTTVGITGQVVRVCGQSLLGA